jgi:hypothetical protein
MEINQTEHLTKKQIMAYYGYSEKDEERHKIGRHLLMCDDCRSQLPPPTREQFLRAVFGDDFKEDSD